MSGKVSAGPPPCDQPLSATTVSRRIGNRSSGSFTARLDAESPCRTLPHERQLPWGREVGNNSHTEETMSQLTLQFLAEQLALGEELLAGRGSMYEPQDLPGRYGRVVKAIDRILEIANCESAMAGGWAVWRHGFFGRMTQDIDIVLPAARIEEFLRIAAVSGFDTLPQSPGRWPKLWHRETGVKVDILPEGARPGMPDKLAPTTIPAPAALGAKGTKLRYVPLVSLIELKLAAGRLRDEYDVVELIRENLDQVPVIRQHLSQVHSDYVAAFNQLVEQARTQVDQ
jgi:hypothetical protein